MFSNYRDYYDNAHKFKTLGEFALLVVFVPLKSIASFITCYTFLSLSFNCKLCYTNKDFSICPSQIHNLSCIEFVKDESLM